jgi:hypothetical protein
MRRIVAEFVSRKIKVWRTAHLDTTLPAKDASVLTTTSLSKTFSFTTVWGTLHITMAEVELATPPTMAPVDENGEETSTALTTTSQEVSAPTGTKVMRKIIRKKRRPARPQVDPSTFKTEPPPQTGTIFNIWYNKWSGGDREDKYLSKTAAAGRCNVAKDTGYTRADKVQGSYFCLFFARGICPKGQECEYLHRLPGIHDMFNPNVDVFGRDKHSDYRDDMGGVGSFMRQNRTIYVGRIHVTDDIEEVVARHFAEWGQIERSKSPHIKPPLSLS